MGSLNSPPSHAMRAAYSNVIQSCGWGKIAGTASVACKPRDEMTSEYTMYQILLLAQISSHQRITPHRLRHYAAFRTIPDAGNQEELNIHRLKAGGLGLRLKVA